METRPEWDINTILSSTTNQAEPPYSAIALLANEIAAFRDALRAQRFTEREIRGMVRYFAMNLLATCVQRNEE